MILSSALVLVLVLAPVPDPVPGLYLALVPAPPWL